MSAASPALYPSFYGAATEYLRLSWEYLRGLFIIYGEAEMIYGVDFQFTGTDNAALRFSAHRSKFAGWLPNFTVRILSLRGVL